MKTLLSKIPLHRLLSFLIIGFPLLLLFCFGLIFFTKESSMKAIEERMEYLIEKAVKMRKREEINELAKKSFREADSHYLSREIEILNLLSKEQEALEKKLSSHLPGGEKLLARLNFLKQSNRIRFVEKSGERKEGIQESLHALSKMVEVDGSDIKALALKLERKEKNTPLLFITDLTLKRRLSLGKSEVFELNLELLKREFLCS